MGQIMRNFTNELDRIYDYLPQMGEVVARQWQYTIDVLVRGEKKKVAMICDADKAVDDFDELVQSATLQLIMVQPPLSNELKALMTMIRIARELERVGDQAVNIAEACQGIDMAMVTEFLPLLEEMGDSTIWMVEENNLVLKEKDLQKAKAVEEKDNVIDVCFQDMQQLLIHHIKKKPEYAESFAQLFLVNRYLERGADHVVNISRRIKQSMY